MLYVIAYDIEDDGVRTRLTGVVEQFGRRVQKSVFECRLSAETREELTRRLSTALGPAAGHVRLYRVCAECWESAFVIGTPDADGREEAAMVV